MKKIEELQVIDMEETANQICYFINNDYDEMAIKELKHFAKQIEINLMLILIDKGIGGVNLKQAIDECFEQFKYEEGVQNENII